MIPSMKIMDLLKAIDENAKIKIVGIRPGEKLHESLISEDEGRSTYFYDMNKKSYYVILPSFIPRSILKEKYMNLKHVDEDFVYKSDQNKAWLTKEKLSEMIKPFL